MTWSVLFFSYFASRRGDKCQTQTKIHSGNRLFLLSIAIIHILGYVPGIHICYCSKHELLYGKFLSNFWIKNCTIVQINIRQLFRYFPTSINVVAGDKWASKWEVIESVYLLVLVCFNQFLFRLWKTGSAVILARCHCTSTGQRWPSRKRFIRKNDLRRNQSLKKILQVLTNQDCPRQVIR